MSQSLLTYSNYKPAALPWLAEVPAHWEIKRAKQVFRTVDQRSETGLEEKLTVSSKNGVVPRREQKVTMFMAASYVAHKLCWPGDLVVNSLWAWANGLGFAKHHGIISTAYSVYRPLPGYAEAGAYLDYLLRSSVFQWEFQIGSKGIWISRLQLTDDTFMRMPILLPPLLEQQRIVAFLDGKTRQITRLLRNKRQLIKLLNEQKQAIIHRAVTQGLDANALRKDSGVAWLGEVPVHWAVKKIKQLLSSKLQYGANEEAQDENLEHPRYIRITDFGDSGILRDNTFKSLIPEKASNYLLKEGDILFARSGATVGKAFLFKNYTGLACFAGYLIKASANVKEILPEFMYLCTQSSFYNQWKSSVFIQTTIQNISAEKYGSLLLPVPPLEEQHEIIAYAKGEASLIDQTIARAQREIELIQEYRTRLIADVVTGRVDVRHLAVTVNVTGLAAELELEDDEESEEEILIETEDGRE